MSDNESESKLPGKSIQIILTIIFIVVALGLVMIVKPFGTVHVDSSKVASPVPGTAPAGAPPVSAAPPK